MHVTANLTNSPGLFLTELLLVLYIFAISFYDVALGRNGVGQMDRCLDICKGDVVPVSKFQPKRV
jgi:hypothetical protein